MQKRFLYVHGRWLTEGKLEVGWELTHRMVRSPLTMYTPNTAPTSGLRGAHAQKTGSFWLRAQLKWTLELLLQLMCLCVCVGGWNR